MKYWEHKVSGQIFESDKPPLKSNEFWYISGVNCQSGPATKTWQNSKGFMLKSTTQPTSGGKAWKYVGR
jgi:hypothetical protein